MLNRLTVGMQDAMGIVSRKGTPHLFVTMTCNPRWREIQEALLPRQAAADRPDISARVFKLKLDAVQRDIIQHAVLGRVVGHVHTIEFQKRGLPHAHILLILHPDDAPQSIEDFDALVCAEIPDPVTHPRLHATVSTCMMHGPCGVLNRNAPCMENGKCSKHFPKEFLDETDASENGYVRMRRCVCARCGCCDRCQLCMRRIHLFGAAAAQARRRTHGSQGPARPGQSLGG
jgi:hypothetical protein